MIFKIYRDLRLNFASAWYSYRALYVWQPIGPYISRKVIFPIAQLTAICILLVSITSCGPGFVFGSLSLRSRDAWTVTRGIQAARLAIADAGWPAVQSLFLGKLGVGLI